MQRMFAALLLSALTLSAAQAQSPAGYEQYRNMTPEQMQALQQNMATHAEAMQKCFDTTGGMETMQRVQSRAEAGMAEVKKRCAAGDRDGAEKQAMKLGLEMNKNKDIQALKKCGEHAQGMMQILPPQLLNPASGADTKGSHVCD